MWIEHIRKKEIKLSTIIEVRLSKVEYGCAKIENFNYKLNEVTTYVILNESDLPCLL